MSAVLLAQGGVEGAVSGAAGVPVAFFVGVVSFFTPCILPLLPGYLSYVSGVSGEELESGGRRSRVLAGTFLFVLGFASLFTLLGYAVASATDRLGFLLNHFSMVTRIAGALVIVMGLAFLSTLSVPRLQRWREGGGMRARTARIGLVLARIFGGERRLEYRSRVGVLGAFPLGAAFAVGWTPCVGPGLATIFAVASTEGSGLRGAILLLAFSLGFGVWFVLGGLAFRRATRALAFFQRHLRGLTLVGGVFLLAIGVLLVTDYWNTLLNPFRRWLVNFTPPI
jgi:cytochrome c-type biogenesis protein